MLRDRVMGIPVGNVVFSDKLAKLSNRTQLRQFKVNEFVNKYYSNLAEEHNTDLVTLSCQEDMFTAEFNNLTSNVSFCFEGECDIDANSLKWNPSFLVLFLRNYCQLIHCWMDFCSH